jgi:hypothetical protein
MQGSSPWVHFERSHGAEKMNDEEAPADLLNAACGRNPCRTALPGRPTSCAHGARFLRTKSLTRRDSSNRHLSVVPARHCQEEMERRTLLSQTEGRETADTVLNFGGWMIEQGCF